VKADIYHLPFPDDEFDMVWCARSLISLDEPVAALREIRRVVRPGGTVAVLEDDEYHRVLLNWPVELELAVQRATATAARARYGTATKFSPARKLSGLFRAAGLRPRGKRTIAADRAAPFRPEVQGFLVHHLRETRGFVAPHLSPPELAAFDRFADPDDPASVFRRPDAGLTFLTTLFLARNDS
jgi:SAM-dependent methyltransferase